MTYQLNLTDIRGLFNAGIPIFAGPRTYSFPDILPPIIDPAHYSISFDPQHSVLELSIAGQEFGRISQTTNAKDTILYLSSSEPRGQIFEMLLTKMTRLHNIKISQTYIVPDTVRNYSPDFISSDKTKIYIGDFTASNEPVKAHDEKIRKYSELFGHSLADHKTKQKLPVKYYAISVGPTLVRTDVDISTNAAERLIEMFHYCDQLGNLVMTHTDDTVKFFKGHVPLLARALDLMPDFYPWVHGPYHSLPTGHELRDYFLNMSLQESDVDDIISVNLDADTSRKYINRHLLDKIHMLAGLTHNELPPIVYNDLFYRPHELKTVRPTLETTHDYDVRSLKFLSKIPERMSPTSAPTGIGKYQFDEKEEIDLAGIDDEVKIIKQFIDGCNVPAPERSKPKQTLAGLGLSFPQELKEPEVSYVVTNKAKRGLANVERYMDTPFVEMQDEFYASTIMKRRPDSDHDRFTQHIMNFVMKLDIYHHAVFISTIAGELLCNRHLYKQNPDGEGNWHLATLPTYNAFVLFTMREDKAHFVVYLRSVQDTSMTDVSAIAQPLGNHWYKTQLMTYGAEQLKLLRLLPEHLSSLLISGARAYGYDSVQTLNQSDCFRAVKLAYASAVLVKRELSNEIIDLRYVLLHSRSSLTPAAVGNALIKLISKKRIVRDIVHAWLVIELMKYVNDFTRGLVDNIEAQAGEDIFGESPLGQYKTHEQFIFLSYLGAESYPRQVPHVDVKYLMTLAEQHKLAFDEITAQEKRVDIDIKLVASLLALEPQHSLFGRLDLTSCLFEDPASALSTKMLARDKREERERSVVNYVSTGSYISNTLKIGDVCPEKVCETAEIDINVIVSEMRRSVREGMVLELTGKIGQKGGGARLITMQTASGRFANYPEQIINNSIGTLPNCILRDNRSMLHLMDNHEYRVNAVRQESKLKGMDLVPAYSSGCQIEDASKFNYLMSVRAMQAAFISSCVTGAYHQMDILSRPRNFKELTEKARDDEICHTLIRMIKLSTGLNTYLSRKCYLNKSLEQALLERDNPEPHMSFLKDCFLGGGTGLAPKMYLHQWYGFGEGNLNATATLLRYAHHILKKHTWLFILKASLPLSNAKLIFDGQYASDDDFDVKTVLVPRITLGKVKMPLIAEVAFKMTCSSASNLSMLVKPQKSTVTQGLGEIYSSYLSRGGGLLKPEMRPHLAMWASFQDASPVDRYHLAFSECYSATQNYGPAVSASMMTLLEIAQFKSLALDPRTLDIFLECSSQMSEPLLGLPSQTPLSLGALSPHIHFQIGRLSQGYLINVRDEDFLGFRVTAGRKTVHDLGELVDIQSWTNDEFDAFMVSMVSGKSGKSATVGGVVSRALQFYMSNLSGNIRHKVQNICSTPYLLTNPSVQIRRQDGEALATTWLALFHFLLDKRILPEKSEESICDANGDLNNPSGYSYGDYGNESLSSTGAIEQWRQVLKLSKRSTQLGEVMKEVSHTRYFPKHKSIFNMVPATSSQSIGTYRQVWLSPRSTYTKQILSATPTLRSTPSDTAGTGLDARRELIHRVNKAQARDRRIVYLSRGSKAFESYLETLERPASLISVRHQTVEGSFLKAVSDRNHAQMQFLLESPMGAVEALYHNACNTGNEILLAVRSRYTPPEHPIFGMRKMPVTPRSTKFHEVELDNNFEGKIYLLGTSPNYCDSIVFSLQSSDGNMTLAQIIVTPDNWYAYTVSLEGHYLPRLYNYVKSAISTNPPRNSKRGLLDPYDLSRPVGFLVQLHSLEPHIALDFKYCSLEPHDAELFCRLTIGKAFEHRLRVPIYTTTQPYMTYPDNFIENITRRGIFLSSKKEISSHRIGPDTLKLLCLSGLYFSRGVRGSVARIIEKYWYDSCCDLGIDFVSAYREDSLACIDVTTESVLCNDFNRYRHSRDMKSKFSSNTNKVYIGTDCQHEDSLQSLYAGDIQVPVVMRKAFMGQIRESRHMTTFEIQKKAARDQNNMITFIAWVMRELADENYRTLTEVSLVSRPARVGLSLASTPFEPIYHDFDYERLEQMSDALLESIQPLQSVGQTAGILDYTISESHQTASIVKVKKHSPYHSRTFRASVSKSSCIQSPFVEVSHDEDMFLGTILASLTATIFPTEKTLKQSRYIRSRNRVGDDAAVGYISNVSSYY